MQPYAIPYANPTTRTFRCCPMPTLRHSIRRPRFGPILAVGLPYAAYVTPHHRAPTPLFQQLILASTTAMCEANKLVKMAKVPIYKNSEPKSTEPRCDAKRTKTPFLDVPGAYIKKLSAQRCFLCGEGGGQARWAGRDPPFPPSTKRKKENRAWAPGPDLLRIY